MFPKRIAVLLTAALVLSVLGGANADAEPGDSIPPAAVTDLAVWSTASDSVTLTWTAPGDDGNVGYADHYDVRYRTDGPVTNDNWLVSLLAWDEPIPALAGSTELFEVISLTEDTTYYFAIKALDDNGNAAGISNSVAGTTAVAAAGEWVKEVAYCKYDPTSNWVCGTPGTWKGMAVFVDGGETRVALGLGHGWPRFAERAGGVWSSDEDFGGSSASGIDAAYSDDGTPTLAFYLEGASGLVLATKAGSDWTMETVDTEAEDANRGGSEPDLAYDPATGEPTIAYSAVVGRGKKTTHYVRFARRTSGGWQIDDVAPIETNDLDLTYDPLGRPTIAFNDGTGETCELKFARLDGTWEVEVAGSGYAGAGDVTLVYDPVTGDPVIFHSGDWYDDGLFLLRYDGATETWDSEAIADDWSEEPRRASLALNSSGVPYISFFTYMTDEEHEGHTESQHNQWFMWHDGSTWRSQWIDTYRSGSPAECRVGVDPRTDLPLVAYSSTPVRFAYVKPGVSEYPDGTPPATVTDLVPNSEATTHDSITLEWTAPGDDGSTGRATEYDIRYTLDGPMDENTWNTEPLNKVSVLIDPTAIPSRYNIVSPAAAGSTESVTIGGLPANTTYYFGLKTRDDVGNWSALAVAEPETTQAAEAGEWAIDVVNEDCANGCGQAGDVDVDAMGRIGTWYVADGSFSLSTRDPGSSTWQHELLSGGSPEDITFGYAPSGEPWATTGKDGPLQVMHKVGTSWITETVDGGEAREPIALVHNPDTGEPHLVFRRVWDVMHAWRDNGTWYTETVDTDVYGTGQWLAFHPTEHYPAIVYAAVWDDHYQIRFARKVGGSWQKDLVMEAAPSPRYSPVYLAYHPIEHYPAIVYPGHYNEGVFYRYRTDSGWSEPQIFDAVDMTQTGGRYYAYMQLVLAFGADGTAYAAYYGQGRSSPRGYLANGPYDVFRIAALGESGWQIVHSEAPTFAARTNDAAGNPANGMPVFMYGYEPPKIIELVPLVLEPGITVAPTSGLVTTEAGGTATFAVRLNAPPGAEVTIALSSSNTDEGTVSAPSPPSLSFTSSDWDVPQTVTVTGVDDTEVDGDVGYTIVTAAAVSEDGDYNGLDAADVSVTNLDDDAPVLTMHVGDLDGQPINLGNKWQAEITILIHDADHDPVAGATVSGEWSAGATGTAECTTDGSGMCTVTSAEVPKSKAVITFTVTDVDLTSWTYEPDDNHDPDEDSDGTTIDVNKP